MKNILITGIAGFIGFHLTRELQTDNIIYGIDDFFDHGDVKRNRTKILSEGGSFNLFVAKITEKNLARFDDKKIDVIIHLAAQAGVPYSIKNPLITIERNVEPFIHVLNFARRHKIPVLYASSSSIYENLSVYSATKRFNEYCARVYKDVPSIGMRFFSVYGEHGRPEQVFYKWIPAIYKGEEITVSGTNKNVKRNFTHVSDVVRRIKTLCQYSTAIRGQDCIDIKNIDEVTLIKCVKIIEKALGKKAIIKKTALQYYDPEKVVGITAGMPGCVPIETGLKNLCEYIIKRRQKWKREI